MGACWDVCVSMAHVWASVRREMQAGVGGSGRAPGGRGGGHCRRSAHQLHTGPQLAPVEESAEDGTMTTLVVVTSQLGCGSTLGGARHVRRARTRAHLPPVHASILHPTPVTRLTSPATARADLPVFLSTAISVQLNPHMRLLPHPSRPRLPRLRNRKRNPSLASRSPPHRLDRRHQRRRGCRRPREGSRSSSSSARQEGRAADPAASQEAQERGRARPLGRAEARARDGP